jgi:hypothetical protein
VPEGIPPERARQFEMIGTASNKTLQWAAHQLLPLERIEPVVPFVETDFSRRFFMSDVIVVIGAGSIGQLSAESSNDTHAEGIQWRIHRTNVRNAEAEWNRASCSITPKALDS